MISELVAGISTAIPALLGTIVGFFLASGHEWWLRKRKIRAHWGAIRAEMTLCKEKADTFINTPVQAPLYRFPVMAVQTAFPILLVEGSLNEQEALAVGRYSSQVEDINRGLDYAASHAMDGDTVGLSSQYNRLVLKTRGLIEASDGGTSLFEAAMAVVDGRLMLWRELV
jgi:hypothetical protein